MRVERRRHRAGRARRDADAGLAGSRGRRATPRVGAVLDRCPASAPVRDRRARPRRASSSADDSCRASPIDSPASAHVVAATRRARRALGGVGRRTTRVDLGAHRALRLGLRLAHLAEHLGRDGVVERRRSPARAPISSAPRPRCAVHRAFAATTTTPLRSRTAGTARTAAAASTARAASAARAEPAPLSPSAPYGALLHELDVVVAERPEEPLGALERAGVVELLERGGRARRRASRERREHRPVERLGDRVAIGAASPVTPSVNFDALRILIARRRPIFIWPSSTAVSMPGRPSPPSSAPRRSRTARAARIGVTTLPLHFDIFLRSGSRIQPLIVASLHGSASCSKCARTTVSNSHVRMISGPCGRRSIGNVRAKRSGSSSQPVAICGVSDDVAHVSITSGSPTNPPGLPRWSSV